MPKIVITAEFDSVAEARNFLAERSAGAATTHHVNVTSAAAPVHPEIVALAATAPAPTQAAAAAAPSTAATTSAPIAPANGVILAPTAAADPRAALRDAMNAYMARGHDVAQGRALILEVAGVGKLKEVPDDKVALLTQAFQTR